MNRSGEILNKIAHLRAANSANWGSVIRRALTLSRDYERDDGFSGRLVNITLETTYRCNLNCGFCFLQGNRLNRRDEELTLAEIASLADQAGRLGSSIYITGGEPFLRKDGVEIVETIKSAGVKTGVNTNATLLDDAKIGRLARTGMDYAIISLHGSAEYHDKVVGKAGSREKAVRAIKSMLKAGGGTHVLVNFVLTEESTSHLAEVTELCAKTGVHALTVQHLTFLTRGDIEAHGHAWPGIFGAADDTGLVYSMVDPSNVDRAAILEAAEKCKELAGKLGVCCIIKPDLDSEMLEAWYSEDYGVRSRCLYPWTDARVAPDGQVYACQFIPYPVGNIRQASLKELLNNERYRKFRKGLKEAGGQFPGCARCCKLYRGGLKSAGRNRKRD
ncbi:MAG TPA: radical SAM protein [Candidatus Brocadiia bacterium]|nr:radical SAM protein [Candidatus Brocadiia bacterium]